MSESTYRDYCNEEHIASPTEDAKPTRPTISSPIPLSTSYQGLPYADGESPSVNSRENISMMPYGSGAEENYNSQPTLERMEGNHMVAMRLASPTDTVNTVIQRSSVNSRASNNSLRRSVGNFEPMIRPEEPMSPPPADLQEEEIISVSNYEGQKLMQQQSSVEKLGKSNTAKSHRRKTQRGYSRADYTPGSCCYCLSSMTCTNMFLWICLILALLGWSVAIWRSVDGMEYISRLELRSDYHMDGFPFTDLTIIVITSATLLFSIVFLIVSSYTSHSLSSYHIPSSQSNKCAYCFTVAMSIFSCIAVILWTLIVAVTMIPTTAISLIHFLFRVGNVDCIHLPSYGITADRISVGSMNINSTSELIEWHCGDDLETWLADSWELMTPLLVSLGCAILIEIVLMGFIMVISSNGRHLYERMGYLMSNSSKVTVASKDSMSEQRQPFI